MQWAGYRALGSSNGATRLTSGLWHSLASLLTSCSLVALALEYVQVNMNYICKLSYVGRVLILNFFSQFM